MVIKSKRTAVQTKKRRVLTQRWHGMIVQMRKADAALVQFARLVVEGQALRVAPKRITAKQWPVFMKKRDQLLTDVSRAFVAWAKATVKLEEARGIPGARSPRPMPRVRGH